MRLSFHIVVRIDFARINHPTAVFEEPLLNDWQ